DEQEYWSGCLNIAASTSSRNETSSSAFHEIAASQSKKDHHVTTTPLRISRRACPVPIGGEAGPLLPRSAALAVSGRVWSVFTLDVGWPAVTGQITRRGRLPPARQDRMRADRDELQETVVFLFHAGLHAGAEAQDPNTSRRTSYGKASY